MARTPRVDVEGRGSGGATASVNWLVTDHLGTPRMVFDQTGALANVSRHDYLPFGEELFGGPPSQPGVGGRTTTMGYPDIVGNNVRQKFTGYESDNETGLNFAQARYHSPAQGRFTSVDPFDGSADIGNPQTFNRYSYVLNDPVNMIDPDGLMANASQSWGDVSGLFWGDDFTSSGGAFGSLANMGEGLLHVQTPRKSTSNANTGEDGVLVIDAVPAFRSRQDYEEYFRRQFRFRGTNGGIRNYVNRLPFNPTKLTSSGLGFVWTGKKLLSGYSKIGVAFGIGAGSRMTLGLPAGAVGVWGVVDVWSAQGSYNRASQQWNEALNEKGSDASWKNFYGLGPWGTEYDDPSEPGPGRILSEKVRNARRKPSEFIREILSVAP